jgi:predicted acylesterase/phospholipase RssA
MEKGFALPPRLVGTSAGAAIAIASATGRIDQALSSCVRLFSENRSLVRQFKPLRLSMEFAHQSIYPNWLQEFVDQSAIARLKEGGKSLLIGISRPARFLGLVGSVLVGSLAYLIDKKMRQSIHPRLPKYLGLRCEFVAIDGHSTLQTAIQALRAAAAAPPFMSAVRLNDRWAIDGGYADNAPLPPQDHAEKSKTLVLLTRFYPKLPTLFAAHGRTYWQPTMKVPVSAWDCTDKATVRSAFDLGRSDALAMWRSGTLSTALPVTT